MMRAALIVALVALQAPVTAAQVPAVPRGPVLQWRGEIGSLAELYRTSDTAGRRPGETGRLYLNSTATLFGSVSLGVNLLLTSEDGARVDGGYGGLPGRQSIAQFGLHPTWSWGRAHLGTFTDGYTPFTYNGVRVAGAAVDVNPGLLRFSAFGGRSREAVATGAATGSYQRNTVGGRLGIGRRTTGAPATYFDVMVVRAADDPTSLQAPIDTTVPVNSPAQAAANPFAVTPEENLVVAAVAGVSLLEQRLAWRAEVAASAHTRDRRATELQDSLVGDYPGLLRGLFTPRVGSHVDYAYSSDLQLRIPTLPGATRGSPRTMTASLQFRSVGPGYVALGAASLPNDQRAVGLQTNIRFRTWSLRLDGARQRDNLLDQKLATTVRYRTAGSFTLVPVRGWNATLRGQYLSMGNSLADSLNQIDYATWTIGTTQVVMLGPRRRIESISFNYTYQRAEDANPRRANTFFLSHSADVRVNVVMGAALKLTPSLGVARQYTGTNPLETRATYGVAAAWRSKSGRLTATSALARSRFTRTNTISAQIGATYRLTEQDELVFSAQTSRYRDYAIPANGFNEQLVSVRWARRF